MAITGVVARTAAGEVTVEEILLDPPERDEARIRVLASGVCHSDLHFKQGALGDDHPFLLGHEGAGVVEEVGSAVGDLRPGDYVALTYRAPCGRCRFCRRAETHKCLEPRSAAATPRTADGLSLTRVLNLGTFATHCVVAAEQAIPIPDTIPPEEACLLGCGVVTGVGAVLSTAGVRPGEDMAVIGCGGVGANVIQGARIARADRVIAIDRDARKLEPARSLGATDVVDASEVDPVEAVRDLTGRGVDHVFDVVGSPATLDQALRMLDHKGTVVLVGVPAHDARLSLPLQDFLLSGATIKACLGGDSVPSRDFDLMTSWIARGDLRLSTLVTRTIGIDQVPEAFVAMEGGEVLRSVIVME